MAAYWENREDAVADKVRSNWQQIQSITERHPYAINWGPLRPQTPRMSLLDPDGIEPRCRPSIPKDLDLD